MVKMTVIVTVEGAMKNLSILASATMLYGEMRKPSA